MKFGFEREFFVMTPAKGNDPPQFVLCPDKIPHDDCGFLAEARGTPQHTPMDAAFSLLAAEHQLQKLVSKLRDPERYLSLIDSTKLSKALLAEALASHGKAPIPRQRGNIYGVSKPFKASVAHAGVHVHFSNEEEVASYYNIRHIPKIFDFPRYIHALDRAFAKEIAAAGRGEGYYEMKPYGVEYRSLPATVDPIKVAEVLEKVK